MSRENADFVPVITSLLDTDLYKLTMCQALLHQKGDIDAEYEFALRNKPAFPLAELKAELDLQLDHLCTLRFAKAELEYLSELTYLKKAFLNFLRVFQLDRDHITVGTDGDRLTIVAKGPQPYVTLFEIYVLATVNELYTRRLNQAEALAEGRRRLNEKIAMLKALKPEDMQRFNLDISDFGLRRRFSGAWHEEVVTTLAAEVPQFVKGTSSVLLARKLGLVPVGTFAHEYLQTHQQSGPRLRDFQKAALEAWVQEYRGDLGIALTDVIGMDAFLRDFDKFLAKLFDGLRHDSGDPFVWGEKAIAHYQKLKIEPSTKRLVFSDGLNIPRALELYKHFGSRIQVAFGIGTNLTNDVGVPALNIVMKLVRCNGLSVAKISDSPGKTLCHDEAFLKYLRQVFEVPEPVSQAS